MWYGFSRMATFRLQCCRQEMRVAHTGSVWQAWMQAGMSDCALAAAANKTASPSTRGPTTAPTTATPTVERRVVQIVLAATLADITPQRLAALMRAVAAAVTAAKPRHARFAKCARSRRRGARPAFERAPQRTGSATAPTLPRAADGRGGSVRCARRRELSHSQVRLSVADLGAPTVPRGPPVAVAQRHLCR